MQGPLPKASQASRALAGAALIFALLATAGCGQKGPLYLPQDVAEPAPATDENRDEDAQDAPPK